MSERWIKVSEDTLGEYQAGALIKAYKSVALAEGQTNPAPEIVKSTVLKIRGAIKSGGYSVDRDEEKIPAELKQEFLSIAVAFLKPRINKNLLQVEIDNKTDALKLLEKIADGKYGVSLPDNPEASEISTQSTGGAQVVRPSKKVSKVSDYNGL